MVLSGGIFMFLTTTQHVASRRRSARRSYPPNNMYTSLSDSESDASTSNTDHNDQIITCLYRGQSNSTIRRDVTHVKVDPSPIKWLKRRTSNYFQKRLQNSKSIFRSAFSDCEELLEVQLCEGLTKIGQDAFRRCTSLRHIKIPSSVKVIKMGAFNDCHNLETVELCEGLEYIEGNVFRGCKSLKRISIPSTVKQIGGGAFLDCTSLSEVELRDGLDWIGRGAFCNCVSLKKIKIPSTIKLIVSSTFQGCRQLISVELCEGLLQTVHNDAFRQCSSLRNITYPQKTLQEAHKFGECHDLLKLFGSQGEIEGVLKNRFEGLPIHQLCYYQPYLSETESIIEQLKGMMIAPTIDGDTSKCTIDNKREDRLGMTPLHILASSTKQDLPLYRSIVRHCPSRRLVTEDKWGSIPSVDCLGMTPLHILACSTKHDISLYRSIVRHCPMSLVTKDKWGCIPILYALWSNVPSEIIQFLIDSQKSAFPNENVNFDAMVETLCRAGSPLEIIQVVLHTRRNSFPQSSMDREKVARELIIWCLLGCNSFEDFSSVWDTLTESFDSSPANEELARTLQETQRRLFPDINDTKWRIVCEELVKPLNGWWRSKDNDGNESLLTFRFLVKSNILERMRTLGVTKWRTTIQGMVESIPFLTSRELVPHFDKIHSKLVSYECKYRQRKDAVSLLELALWKSKIDQSSNGVKDRHHRTNCGADVIIPNVLPYLADSEEEDGVGGDGDDTGK